MGDIFLVTLSLHGFGQELEDSIDIFSLSGKQAAYGNSICEFQKNQGLSEVSSGPR